MSRSSQRPLAGVSVVITRPAGTARPLSLSVLALGGTPVSVPGMSLRTVEDADAVRAALAVALEDDILVFTSPAAVRFAANLLPLRSRALVVAVGQGTVLALNHAGLTGAICPAERQDSEGLLDLPQLASLQGLRVALICAPGGRGILRRELAARGAQLREVHVYRRVAPRLDRRHIDPLLKLTRRSAVLLSSADALEHLQHALPRPAWNRLREAVAVVSSERLRKLAEAAGFSRVIVARSAMAPDLLEAASSFTYTRA
jgi:uroporphyrinogen-III synthase